MAGKESTQHWLDRNRPPRVQITYDVETGGASEKKELPMVMGIMADLYGNKNENRPRIKDRKFVEIDRDNLNAVMSQVAPRVGVKVKVQEGGQEVEKEVVIALKEMDDFSPAALVKEVDVLQALYARRTALNDLLAKLDGNDDLDAALQRVVKEPDPLKALTDWMEKSKPA